MKHVKIIILALIILFPVRLLAVTKPTIIISFPNKDTFCNGESVKFSVAAVALHKYHWRVSNSVTILSGAGDSDADSTFINITFNTIGFKPGSATVTVWADSGIVPVRSAAPDLYKDFFIGPNAKRTLQTTGYSCASQSGNIIVNGADAGVTYRAWEGITDVTDFAAGSTLYLKNTLSIGTHTITVKGANGPFNNTCLTKIDVDKSFNVDTFPTINYNVDLNTPTICIDKDSVVLHVNGSKLGEVYNVFIDGIPALNGLPLLVADVLGTGGAINITVAKTKIQQSGSHRIYVTTRRGSCPYFAIPDTSDIVVKPKPNLGLPLEVVSDKDSICPGENITVTIKNTEAGFKYVLKDFSTKIADTIVGNGANQNIVIASTKLITNSNKLLVWVQSEYNSCYLSRLTDTAMVKLEKLPSLSAKLSAKIFKTCDVEILPIPASLNYTETGVGYTARLNSVIVGDSFPGTGSPHSINIINSKLNSGPNTIYITGQVKSCPAVNVDTLSVYKGKKINLNLFTKGDTICPYDTGTIKIYNSEDTISYAAYIGSTKYSNVVIGKKNTTITLKIPTNGVFAPGTNPVFTIRAYDTYNTICKKDLLKTDTITIYNLANPLLQVQGGNICTGDSGIITITNPNPYVLYKAYRDTTLAPCDSVISNSTSSKMKIASSCLPSDTTQFIVRAYTGYGRCPSVDMLMKPTIQIVPYPSTAATLSYGTYVCPNNSFNFAITPSIVDVNYMVYNRLGNKMLDVLAPGNGTTLSLTIVKDSLHFLLDTFSIRAIMKGLCSKNLNSKPTIKKISLPNNNLTVYSNQYLCPSDAGLITIDSTEKDVFYKAQITGFPVSSSHNNPLGGQLQFSIPPIPIEGTYEVKIIAQRKINGNFICDSVFLADTTSFKVRTPNTSLVVSKNTTCVGINGHVDISASESGVTYQAFVTGVAVSEKVKGVDGQKISLIVLSNAIISDSNRVIVKATIGSCDPYILDDTAIIKVIAFPDTTLNILSDNKCPETNLAHLVVIAPQTNAKYIAYTYYNNVRGVSLDSVDGNTDATISIPILISKLQIGNNPIAIYANNGCGDIKMKVIPYVNLVDTPELAFNYIERSACYGSDAKLSIKASQMGVMYFAKSSNNIISDKVTGTGDTIDLTFSSQDLIPDYYNNIEIWANIGCIDWKLDNLADIYVSELSKSGTISANYIGKCTSSQNATLTLNNKLGTIKDWIYSNDTIHWTSTGKTSTILAIDVINQDVYYKAIVANYNCLADTSDPIKLRLMTMPLTNLTLIGDTICERQDGRLLLKNYEHGVMYSLRDTSSFTVVSHITEISGNNMTLIVPGIKNTSSFFLFCAKQYVFNEKIESCLATFRVPVTLNVVNIIHATLIDSSHLKLKCDDDKVSYSIKPKAGVEHHWSIYGGEFTSDTIAEQVNVNWFFQPEFARQNRFAIHSIDIESQCVFSDTTTIIIDDSIKPIITCPSDIYYILERNQVMQNTISYPVTNPAITLDPIYSDNCGIQKIVNDYNASSSLKDDSVKLSIDVIGFEYSRPIRWTVYDLAGNYDSCYFSIHYKIIDELMPVSAFTPNGDATNPTWKIEKIDRYPEAQVKVYDRYGKLVWDCPHDCGSDPWDGLSSQGLLVPVDSYHFQIYLNGKIVNRGVITVIY